MTTAKKVAPKRRVPTRKATPAPAAAPAKKAAPKKRVPVKKDAAPAPAKKAVAKKGAAKKAAPAKAAPAAGTWDKDASPGSNVNRLKDSGLTWKAIGFLWNEAGIEPEVVPGADGGKLLRARTQFLKGTEGQAPKRGGGRKRAVVGGSGTKAEGDDRPYEEQAAERLAEALSRRKVPWEGNPDEYSDEELLAMLDGKGIEFVSKVSGRTASARILKGGKHTKIGHGEDGPWIEFAEAQGPFMFISLSRIISVS